MITVLIFLTAVAILIVVAAALGRQRRSISPENKSYTTTVAGVTKQNPDGTHRQQILKNRMYTGMPLRLEAEPENPHDPKAVAVYAANEKVGYLPRGYHIDIFNALKQSRRVTATVEKLTGGTRDKPAHGLVIRLTKFRD